MQESIRHAEQLLEKAEVVTLAVNGEDGCPRAYVAIPASWRNT